MVEFSDISSKEIRSTLFKTIENALKTTNFKFSIIPASRADENNIVGIIYRVVFARNDEIEYGKYSIPRQLILKVAPRNAVHRIQFLTRPAFVREIYAYNKVLPILRKFEQLKGAYHFDEYPKCYKTVDVDINECLLLEDLTVRNFTVIDRHHADLTPDHVRLVMKTLGKFHAISFALKDQEPQVFKELTSNLDEILIRKDDDKLRDFFNKQSEHVFNSVSSEEDTELFDKVYKFYEKDVLDIAVDCLDLNAADGATVISHGDAWQNNIMFRHDRNGKPVQMALIDWQTTRHSSPIIDIIYFLFCCTTKELRDNYYEEMLNVYHVNLSTHMRRLGSNPDKLFPFTMLLEHCRKFAKFGLILSTALLPIMTSDDGNQINFDELAEDVKRGKELDENLFATANSRNEYYARLRDVVIDMIELEYI
ncbi:uncharacterized protein LOC116343428 [Contarinia nasturtii]|uniref:uncharacterized protein LOC116343428 n=1 Tax=Contarinia nasturtii TaxID=265458 RepID=UPI0012D40715|nr:uncharacterized protein LOC116343428 [Contarinia nasturtii]